MKRIVVCFDGTWNNDDLQTDDTNVSRLARAIHGSQETDGVIQIVLYLRGVGTTGLLVGKLIAAAIGLGIDDNIRSAYQFIAQNYVPGDQIYLFGFSRGAFTARSLSGLITACGILHRRSLGALADAWAYYRTDRPHDPAAFAAKYGVETHTEIEIALVGVWDTVGSLGIPGDLMTDFNKKAYAFHDTEPSRLVKRAAHALAIDEHRHSFTPTFWTGAVPPGCTIEQVWFAGAHADVGGGYRTRALADIPLAWMADKAEEAGLRLDRAHGLLPDPAALDPAAAMHDSSSGLFTLDRYRPTLRRIGGRDPADVGLTESVYEALDAAGRPTATIGEAVHRSAVERYGRQAMLCSDDETGTCGPDLYEPKTLRPFFAAGSFSGLPVVG